VQNLPTSKDVIESIEKSAENLNISVHKLIRLSDISHPVWSNWKSGYSKPTFKMVDRINETINRLKSESK
jgi:predicted transcriptional regulator